MKRITPATLAPACGWQGPPLAGCYSWVGLVGPLSLGLRRKASPSGQADLRRAKAVFATTHNNWRTIYALLELYRATDDRTLLKLACRIADNILTMQTETGLFPRPGRVWARTGDEIPLALLHLAAAINGKSSSLPPAIFDSRLFHCEYHGELEEHQKKRNDKWTYDNYVFYGGS